MNNLLNTLKIIFNTCDIKDTFEDVQGDYLLNKFMDIDVFTSVFLSNYPTLYSGDELKNLVKLIEGYSMTGQHNSIFNLLYQFSSKVLTIKSNSPLIRFDNLINWCDLARIVGEDLLTCSFLAKYDIEHRISRSDFSWPANLKTLNSKVQHIIERGLAENHMHLKGSAPHFQLSWISLMNDISNRKYDFHNDELKISLRNNSINREKKTLQQVILAADTRSFLTSKIIGYSSFDNICIRGDFEEEYNIKSTHIQSRINLLKTMNGIRINTIIPDYCINRFSIKNENINNPNLMLFGERWFLYNVFKLIFKNEISVFEMKLFHSYLLTKSKLRSEIIQVNGRVGFDNFSTYQNRKSIFIKNDDFLKECVVKMAIAGSNFDQTITKMETRIAPENSRTSYHNTIVSYDKYVSRPFNYHLNPKYIFINDFNRPNHFYVVHFIKQQDDERMSNQIGSKRCLPKNKVVRNKIKVQAIELAKFHQLNIEHNKRILGIDAANYEIGCRPEVFAHCFRYLRNLNSNELHYSFNNSFSKDLGFTYHVGEDFLDPISGLRAVHEVINFLEFNDGDRIGHALVLGLDIEEYYNKKHYSTLINKQDYLDNIAWLYHMSIEHQLGDSAQNAKLLSLFDDYFAYVYNLKSSLEYSIHDYYKSYLLRSDSPYCYIKRGELSFNSLPSSWNKYQLQQNGLLDNYRRNRNALELNHDYHFSYRIRERGNEVMSFVLDKTLLKLIEKVQYKIRELIYNHNISIETNPSSNLLIGNFSDLSKHPIFNFYNHGLPFHNKNDLQLHVSINTDDQGVFSTNLENEFALIACALESINDQGQQSYSKEYIYEWLEKVRQKGFEQSFFQD